VSASLIRGATPGAGDHGAAWCAQLSTAVRFKAKPSHIIVGSGRLVQKVQRELGTGKTRDENFGPRQRGMTRPLNVAEPAADASVAARPTGMKCDIERRVGRKLLHGPGLMRPTRSNQLSSWCAMSTSTDHLTRIPI